MELVLWCSVVGGCNMYMLPFEFRLRQLAPSVLRYCSTLLQQYCYCSILILLVLQVLVLLYGTAKYELLLVTSCLQSVV